MPPGRRIQIIANPTSGKGRSQRTAQAVAANLRARGIETEITYTQQPGDAQSTAEQLCSNAETRPDCIVACGGDGTVQEVANALAKLKDPLGSACPTMGLAPAGRCNDFARALHISKDPATIAETLATGRRQATDLGLVNDRCFCTVATVGADADVSSFVDSMKMPLTGTVAYLYGAVRVLARYRPCNLRISGDFGEINDSVFLASTANTSSYGGAIKIAPDAIPTDGQLDLCVIEGVSRLRALSLLPTVLRGRHKNLPEVRFIRTRKFQIESDSPRELWADGERIAITPVTIEVIPAAIDLMVPKSLAE